MGLFKKMFLLIFTALLFITSNTCYAAEKQAYISGVADGFPPYQFKSKKEDIIGFDADVMRMVFKKMGKNLTFKQMKWNDVVGTLMFTEKIDCVTGMEINPIRERHFDFTSPYYIRKTALFTLFDNTDIKQLEDLPGKIIAGDKGSYLEMQLEKLGIKKDIRIKHTSSKEESMQLLKTGKFSAIIAPKEVGLYLAKKLHVNVKIVAVAAQGSPVAIAVKKGNSQLLNMLENSLQQLIQDGEIKKLQLSWNQ
jgi:ABC-type amino acid transport substrate-binding protein